MEDFFLFPSLMNSEPSPPGELAVVHCCVIFIIIRRGRKIKKFKCLTLQQSSCDPGDTPSTSCQAELCGKNPQEWPFDPFFGHLRKSVLVRLDGPYLAF